MKRFCLIILSFLFIIPSTAYASEAHVSAGSAVVMDAQTKTILFERSAYEPRSMASTTKIMTCLLACEYDNANEMVTITPEMLDGAIGSLIYLNAGDKITLLDLIKGAMLASGNDSANAIAVWVGGSVDDFVSMMNKRADEIGMRDTLFVTPSGLDEGNHHSTAYDMALLSCEAMSNELFCSICCLSSADITINGKKQTVYNHNKLLSYNKSCVGIKTGFTEKAGRCLVSAYDYKGNKIIIVTLSAPDDWNDHQRLYKMCKSRYKQRKVKYNCNLSVVGGVADSVKCVAKSERYSLNELTTRAYYYPFIYAPINRNDIVGRLEVYDNDLLVMTVDIIVGEDVEQWQEMK